MLKRLEQMVICLVFICVVAFNLSACSTIQGKGKIIKDVIYAREVPASFETALICRVDEREDGALRFKWFSDNGTIKGDESSTIWVAPLVPGTYKIGVTVTDESGTEDTTTVSIQVVSFGNSLIDTSPEITLEVPIWGSESIGERQLINPMMTAEIECQAPLAVFQQYTYKWWCNGGKMQGTGIKEGTASRIGWIPPGVPGNYTVIAKITDSVGNTSVGCVYFNVVNPACCGGNGICGGQ